jgi:hypothetical protein
VLVGDAEDQNDGSTIKGYLTVTAPHPGALAGVSFSPLVTRTMQLASFVSIASDPSQHAQGTVPSAAIEKLSDTRVLKGGLDRSDSSKHRRNAPLFDWMPAWTDAGSSLQLPSKLPDAGAVCFPRQILVRATSAGEASWAD